MSSKSNDTSKDDSKPEKSVTLETTNSPQNLGQEIDGAQLDSISAGASLSLEEIARLTPEQIAKLPL